jgi:hypothetical protein
MPALKDHHSTQTTKLLFVGDSGAGKTGALASLAGAGYKIRILDLDNGVDVLHDLLTSKSYPPDAIANVESVVTLTDKMKNVNGKLMPAKATVWQRAVGMLEDWTDGDLKFGPITSWDTNTVLVIDSLTFLGNAAVQYVVALNGRLHEDRPHLADWGVAQGLIENLIRKLYDENVKCNVIVNCHQKLIEGPDQTMKWQIASPGKALAPIIPRYFNTVLLARSSGRGSNIKREIFTSSQGTIECKNTAPSKVKPSYPLESGLAEYFAAVRS